MSENISEKVDLNQEGDSSPEQKKFTFKDTKQHLLVFLQGLALGATFRLPGVSGGTIAIIMGVYHKLLHAINHIFSEFKKSAIFLGVIGLGGIISFFLLNRVLLEVTEAIPAISAYFFIGMIIASFPAIYKDSQIKIRQASRKQILIGLIPLLIGLGIIAGLGAIQTNVNLDFTGFAYHAYVVVAGILGGMVFILPGLSFMYFLMILGIDNDFATAVDTFDFSFILPFAIGMVIGLLIAVKVVFLLLKKFRAPTYLVIMGFLAGSIVLLLTDPQFIPRGADIGFSILALFLGMALIAGITFAARYVTARKSKSDATSL
ncbi:MAG: DUF368 domain-containing protein [Firmicutes bacterium]|nr:DUF368 domain-containing protein [Bacillota bacterium]